jgi:hypothetical protein
MTIRHNFAIFFVVVGGREQLISFAVHTISAPLISEILFNLRFALFGSNFPSSLL